MRKLDLAVVGSGMGGAMIASLNKHKDVVLFEKDKNLGGCASTFKKFNKYYNTGATTFVGYEKNHIVKEIFDKSNFTPSLTKSKIAFRIIQNGKVIDRVKDFDLFLEQLNLAYPNKNNYAFWNKIKDVDERFWKLNSLYYCKYSLKSYVKTLNSFAELFSTFKFELFKSAKSFIKESLGDISQEYQNFIDSQLMITIQSTSQDIPMLFFCLGLAYPFHDVFYVNGGMGSLFDGLLKDIEVKKDEQILKILIEADFYKIISKKGEYLSKNVVLNSSIYDCKALFEDKNRQDYYSKFSFSDQSAFVINLTINSNEDFLHHYQIILEKTIPNSVANSFFVSFSSKDDKKMSKNGLSITISTHTKSYFWQYLSISEYKRQKLVTQTFIIEHFLRCFTQVKKEQITDIFSSTSKTFKRYINRFNCGGRAITFKNILQTPSCKTPFSGLYNIGDTIFAGQGWPGVALGVKVLNEELNI